MKTRLYFITAGTIASLLVLLFSCSQTRPRVNPIDPAFSKYISGFTSGMISRKSVIRIELAQGPKERNSATVTPVPEIPLTTSMEEISIATVSMADSTAAIRAADSAVATALQLPDSNLLKNAFEFEPAVKGRAHWVSSRVIEFVPDEPLPSNQFYDVSFKLKNVAKVKESELKTFHFQFSTFVENISVSVDGLRSYDDYDPVWQKLTGTIKSADYEDTASIRKILSITRNGKKLPFSLTNGYEHNEFFFYVDSIERRLSPSTLVVSWDGTVVNALNKGSEEVIVRALGDFGVSSTEIKGNEDEHLEITFSDPLDRSQNLKGLITLKDVDELTYAVEGNVLKVFLPNKLEGEKVLTVSTGIRNFRGYKMLNAYTTTLLFEAPKPLVRLKGKGSILPNSNGLIFPFEAISVKAVDVRVIKIFENNVLQFLQVNNLDESDGMTRVGKVIAEKTIQLDPDKKLNLKQWNRHVIDLRKLIEPDPGAIYRVSIRFRKAYAFCDCEAENSEGQANPSAAVVTEETGEHPVDWSEAHWHSYGYGGYSEYKYYYDDDHSPCDNYYYEGRAVSRNILASDIGMIYKLDENKLSHAFVSNMITARPMPNTLIEYYDYTRQLIAQGTTNQEGMLDLQLTRKPFVMVARSGRQRGYLKLEDNAANSLSTFDVEGEVVQRGVKGFIYGDRGVWRPGDSLYLNFIMEDKENRLPPNHPVKFELQDPAGNTVYQVTKTKNINGLYDFRTATDPSAVTGNYSAIARVGNRMFSSGVKIETVKPNRLKIYLDFENAKVNDSVAKLSVKWLHGAVAKNLEAVVNVNVNQSKTRFEKFRSYEFDSPIRNYYSESELVFSGNLDEKGEATISTSLHAGKSAPGMLRATYVTKVFEQGGDFSIDRYSVPYSPYNTYVGLLSPDSRNFDNSLETGGTHQFHVVTVNKKGEPVSSDRLQVKIYKLEWRWWYEKEEEDLSSYVTKAGSFVVKDTLIKTKEGRAFFNFRVEYPEYGRYLVLVNDLRGGHQTGKIVTVDWPYWSRGNRSNSEAASMLSFACDKGKYFAGENIKLSFPSPADGLALVSVETSRKVIKKFWISTKKGETVHQFQATSDMSPNAYVHITLVQPHANTKNDLPIRMYGVMPVLVEDRATHLEPEIRMPEVIKPESAARIAVKEKNGRKMTYTLAMVDEGLLDLTRFKTPQPWSTFYAREALGVKTWDIYDHVIGAYAGKLDKLLSIGGDGDGNGGKGLKANRFKPMVKFMGPFVLEAGQEKVHNVEIPNYIGSVRVMVVAQQEGAYGNAEKAVSVRKPLMLLATLPRVLGPGESVSLPVNVFAMESHVKDVKIDVEVNDLLQIEGGKTQSMHFTQAGDEVINFRLNVAQKLGIAKVKVTATSGKEKAVQEIELDVRPSNPKVSEGLEIALEAGKTWDTQLLFKGLQGSNKATIEFSGMPSLGLEKRLDYLMRYPHGCIEQTTSSVFPQLFVMQLINMKEADKLKVSQHIKAGLKRLQLFQTAAGGFAYWPGEAQDSEWGSNYAGHFMLEAEKQGYSLPANMKSRWLNYQQKQARSWSPSSSPYLHAHGNESYQVIQAYRLFVLALSGNADMSAMNRLREEAGLYPTAKWRLAAAYMLAGQTEVALKLTQGLSTKVDAYKELSYSYGSEIRDQAMILETLCMTNEKQRGAELAKRVAKSLSAEQQWMSTQETAYSLLAMCAFIGVKDQPENLQFTYTANEAEKAVSTKNALYQVKYSDKDFAQKTALQVKNTGKRILFVKVSVEGIPMTEDKSASAKHLSMVVKYKDMQGKEIQPGKLVQGTEFMAEVSISNPGTKGFLKEMALDQIFPAGWEIHNTRLDGTGQNSQARYQDIRDDRVYSYYELPENSSKTFTVHLNATYLGRFYLPSVYSEAMYDHTIHAKIPGRWVEVVKELPAVAGTSRSR